MEYKRKSFTAWLYFLLINPRSQQLLSHSVVCLSYNNHWLSPCPLCTDDNVFSWREAFSKTFAGWIFTATCWKVLSGGVTWASRDRWTCLFYFFFFFFTDCLSLFAGTGPSSTNNICFAVRRVQSVCKLELLFFLLCPCSTLHPSASSRPASRIWVCQLRNAALCWRFYLKSFWVDFWHPEFGLHSKICGYF